MLMLEVVGTWGRVRSQQAEASSLGSSWHAALQAAGVSVGCLCCLRSAGSSSGCTQTCKLAVPSPRVGSPSPLQLRVLILLCSHVLLVGPPGKEGCARALCLLASLRGGEGGRRLGCADANACRIYELFVLFSLFCFLLQQSVIEQVSWDN